jgi:hypothetical protein
MESNYYKSSSYEETTTQVSLMFEYKQYSGQIGYDSASIWATITETFKKNTAALSVFQPPVASEKNRSDWE